MNQSTTYHQKVASEKELLRFFLEHEQTIRKEDPGLFWQLVDRLTSNRELIQNPGNGRGFYFDEIYYLFTDCLNKKLKHD